MIEGLKYASIIAVCLTIAYILLTLRDCSPAGLTPGREVISADSGYVPVIVENYRPPSTPFERPGKKPIQLPEGIKEDKVQRVITVSNKGSVINIIELKSGELRIPDAEDSLQVEITNFLEPFIRFGLFAEAGVSLGSKKVSPSVSVSLIKIDGRYSLPVFVADLTSIGAGIGMNIYNDISITPLLMWNYSDTQRSIKLNVSIPL